jgi:hypothetical protein
MIAEPCSVVLSIALLHFERLLRRLLSSRTLLHRFSLAIEAEAWDGHGLCLRKNGGTNVIDQFLPEVLWRRPLDMAQMARVKWRPSKSVSLQVIITCLPSPRAKAAS